MITTANNSPRMHVPTVFQPQVPQTTTPNKQASPLHTLKLTGRVQYRWSKRLLLTKKSQVTVSPSVISVQSSYLKLPATYHSNSKMLLLQWQERREYREKNCARQERKRWSCSGQSIANPSFGSGPVKISTGNRTPLNVHAELLHGVLTRICTSSRKRWKHANNMRSAARSSRETCVVLLNFLATFNAYAVHNSVLPAIVKQFMWQLPQLCSNSHFGKYGTNNASHSPLTVSWQPWQLQWHVQLRTIYKRGVHSISAARKLAFKTKHTCTKVTSTFKEPTNS